jgi:hypothetical protein
VVASIKCYVSGYDYGCDIVNESQVGLHRTDNYINHRSCHIPEAVLFLVSCQPSFYILCQGLHIFTVFPELNLAFYIDIFEQIFSQIVIWL